VIRDAHACRSLADDGYSNDLGTSSVDDLRRTDTALEIRHQIV
jgi:hypothetical protein